MPPPKPVIRAFGKKGAHLPYRASKLTQFASCSHLWFSIVFRLHLTLSSAGGGGEEHPPIILL